MTSTAKATNGRSPEEIVAFDGDGYLDDPEVADLFAFLLETNEARQSVARADELRETIVRPVDIDEIKEIKRQKRRYR
ncbi:hypothetical protein [Haloarcula sp. JP-L23]|uniref:hypothetical protein n=1 Tax=Haloarcula sp. JP-L23 TaxID=2716717 RepID=UPI00140F4897|nr:hypothetical protein G9465_18820 [Haloarcula sp. JP-L23]